MLIFRSFIDISINICYIYYEYKQHNTKNVDFELAILLKTCERHLPFAQDSVFLVHFFTAIRCYVLFVCVHKWLDLIYTISITTCWLVLTYLLDHYK